MLFRTTLALSLPSPCRRHRSWVFHCFHRSHSHFQQTRVREPNTPRGCLVLQVSGFSRPHGFSKAFEGALRRIGIFKREDSVRKQLGMFYVSFVL
ncbi:hypothetical protein ACOSP7_017167 [Xanthoceras sorbifolium]